MNLKLAPSLTEKIENQYEEWMQCCPNRKKEVYAWILQANAD